MKLLRWTLQAAALFGLAACTALQGSGGSTPLPFDYMPTAAALTLAAQGIGVSTQPAITGATRESVTPGVMTSAMGDAAPETTVNPAVLTAVAATQTAAGPRPTLTRVPTSTPTRRSTRTPTPRPTLTFTPTPTIDPILLSTALAASAQPYLNPLGQPQTATAAPPFPPAPIQIYRLGELSRVISPLEVNTYITSIDARVARIELYGEDGRLMARHMRTAISRPGELARIGVSLDFEAHAAAEAGRLVVSVEDTAGRLRDVNSIELLLLSVGMNQINPATGLWQRLIIQEPQPNALIVGGELLVSGRALPNNPEQPLRVVVYGSDGKVLGNRLAGIEFPIPGDYGIFQAAVPYSVNDITPALVVVYEEGGDVSDIAHLSSLDVILSP